MTRAEYLFINSSIRNLKEVTKEKLYSILKGATDPEVIDQFFSKQQEFINEMNRN